MKFWRLTIIFLVGLLPIFASVAQEPIRPIITIENADQLTQIGSLGHGTVTDLGWASDGETLIVAVADGLWLYNGDDLQAEPDFIPSQHGWIRSMAMHPTQPMVALGNQDGTVALLNFETGEIENLFTGDGVPIYSVGFNGDGSLLVAGSDEQYQQYRLPNSQVWIWETETGTLRHQYSSEDIYTDYYLQYYWEAFRHFSLWNVALSPDSQWLAVGGTLYSVGHDRTQDVFFINLETGERLMDISKGQAGPFRGGVQVLFSPDNQWWVTENSGVWDRTLMRGIGKEIMTWNHPAVFSGAGDYYIAAQYYSEGEESIHVWDTTSWRHVSIFGVEEPEKLAAHPQEPFVAALNPDETIDIWNFRIGVLVDVIDDFFGEISDLDISPTSNQLAVAYGLTGAQLWDLDSLSEVIEVSEENTFHVAFHPSEPILAYDRYDDRVGNYDSENEVHLWDVALQEDLITYEAPASEPYQRWLGFSPDSKFLLVFTEREASTFWELESQSIYWQIDDTVFAEHFAFHPNGNQLLAAGYDNVVIFDLETQQLEQGATLTFNIFETMAISPDGEWLAVSGTNIEDPKEWLYLLNYNTGGVVRVMITHSRSGFNHLEFSPDGSLLIYGNNYGELHLISTETSQVVEIPSAQLGRVVEFDFNHDGTILAVGYSSGVVLLWGVEAP
jgi:WD40 repeat protein